MTDFRFHVIEGGASPVSPPRGETGAEFVARIDVAEAQRRFRAMLEAEAASAANLERGLEAYADFDADVGVDDALAQNLAAVSTEIVGTVRSYDSFTGLGIVIDDRTVEEVVLSAAPLMEAGIECVFEGARIQGVVQPTLHERRISKVYWVDLSTVIHPSFLPFGPDPDLLAQASPWVSARVSFYNRRRGTALAQLCDDGGDVYVPRRMFELSGLAHVSQGIDIQLRWAPHGLRRIAVGVTGASGDPFRLIGTPVL